MGRTLNVSEGGCLLETHIPLKQGQGIQLTVALDEQIMELEGTIVHVKPCGEKGFCSGIQFVAPDHDGKQILKKYIEYLQMHMDNIRFGEIATLCGRYYAMDRDKRWERIRKAFLLYTKGDGLRETDPVQAVKNAYQRMETDEFIETDITGGEMSG